MRVIYRDMSVMIEHASYACFLTDGKVYDGEKAPLVYDANTFAPIHSFLIRCDDGKLRSFRCTTNFIPVEELRDEKLKQIFE